MWVEDVVVARFPVTNRRFLAFLDDLVAQGREEEAVGWAPRRALTGSPDGDLWDPDWPALLIDHGGASAYAAWLGARDGQPWRLPHEYEREKASRGVDGRMYPWGDAFDPTWCWMRESGSGKPHPAPVGVAPADESPYGVRDVAGGVMDWTISPFRESGPPVGADGSILADEENGRFTCRGGAWQFRARGCAVTSRWTRAPLDRRFDGSFRPVFRPGFSFR